MPETCPFCPANLTATVLWENAAYRIIADQYPLCSGHVLVISQAHYPSHMHAPLEQLGEFEAAQAQARRFLYEVFGRASFYENGNTPQQDVHHAHLHGLPFTALLPDGLIDLDLVQSMTGWQAVRQRCEQEGSYTYLESGAGRFLLQDQENILTLLNIIRKQVAAQVGTEIDTGSGELKRSGAETTVHTIQLWQAWAQTTNRA